MSDRWRDDGQVVYRRKAKENKMLRAVQGNREEGSGQRKFSQMRKRRGKWIGDTTITFLITVTKDLTRSNSRNESPAWGPWMVEEIAARWLLQVLAHISEHRKQRNLNDDIHLAFPFIFFCFLLMSPAHRILLLTFRGGMWSLLGMLDTMCLLGNSKSIQFDNETNRDSQRHASRQVGRWCR